VLQRGTHCCRQHSRGAGSYVAVWCSALQRVAACCSVLQHVAVVAKAIVERRIQGSFDRIQGSFDRTWGLFNRIWGSFDRMWGSFDRMQRCERDLASSTEQVLPSFIFAT